MADRGDSGRPSDARREAAANAIDAALKAGVEISPQRLAHLALDAADAVSEPTPRVVWTKNKWYDGAAGEPLIPPRALLDFDETKERVESMIWAYLSDQMLANEITHRLLNDTPLREAFEPAATSESRAAALEGALRALVAATVDHAKIHPTYGPEYCTICKAMLPALALLAESPQPDTGETR